MEKIKFANTQRDFFATLNHRVNEYFNTNKIARHGNMEMVIKTIFMFMLYFAPYALILTGAVISSIGLALMVILMALGLAGIGLSVMHDANHGAYSKSTRINNIVGYSLNLVGANAFNWKVQHNVLHHTYTNVHEEDEDISPRGAPRLTPHTEWKKIHRYQSYLCLVFVWVNDNCVAFLQGFLSP